MAAPRTVLQGTDCTPLAREQTMEYFFDNVSGNGIVGGDLNMSKNGIRDALETWSWRTGKNAEGD